MTAHRTLRAADLVPGSLYYSPTGRLCMLLAPKENGISRTSYLFAYLTRTGRTSEDEGFALSVHNAQAIAALRAAGDGAPPPPIHRFMAARGMA